LFVRADSSHKEELEKAASIAGKEFGGRQNAYAE